MTTFTILRQTARALLANPPVYFLCTVYVTAASSLIAGLTPEFHGPLATKVVQAITATLMAMATLPGIAIVTWYTACHRDGRPTTLRESLRPIRQNALSLFSLAALLGLGWHLPGAVRELPLPFPFYMILPTLTALFLLRFSVAFPIALLECQSPRVSLSASWQRLQWHWWTAAGIAVCYVLAAAAIGMLLFPSMATMEPWKLLVIGVSTYAILQALWAVSITCLYVHVSPAHQHLAHDANTDPPPLEDLPPPDASDMHHGEPHALADFGDVTRAEDTARG